MKYKIFTERFEIRFSPEQLKMVKEIAKKLRTTDSEAIRICIMLYWKDV